MNIRKALGLNLSNTINKGVDAESPLQKEICLLFDRDDVSRMSPDVKKLVSNPDKKMEKVPACLRLSTLKVLHAKFEAESSRTCSYQILCQNTPYYVIKPKPTNWGTCLCGTSLNPELKLFAPKKIQGDAVF